MNAIDIYEHTHIQLKYKNIVENNKNQFQDSGCVWTRELEMGLQGRQGTSSEFVIFYLFYKT